MTKEQQLQLVEETAKRIAQSGNNAVASCLYSICVAMAVGYEEILASKLVREIKKQLNANLDD